MVKLSARLMLMADQIEKNETMADIGTDHGFLPMYLADEGICPKVILTDVSAGSLKKAQEEDMPVLATGKTAYEVSVLMGQAGVLPPAE